VAAPRTRAKGRRRDAGRDSKRAGYGGTFTGCILTLDAGGRTVRLNDQLRRLLDVGPYDQRPVALFALARPGHRNPRGTAPSRADCWLMTHGAWDYARFRQAEALRRDGAVQAVRVEDLLGRWTGVNLDNISRRRLLPAFVDRLEVELAGAGDVALAGPIERHRQAGRCELRLQISPDRRPRSPTRQNADHRGRRDGSRRPRDDRRPPVASTASGTATSTGPPRP
jgi:hypothetical protein